ncbi:MAG: hypothetical protein ACR2KF_08575 [Nitrososphaeraceae archaeon]
MTLRWPCQKCGTPAHVINTKAGSWELQCPNPKCGIIVDDRPEFQPVDTPKLGQSERQRPRKYIPDPSLYRKKDIRRLKKLNRFCITVCQDDFGEEVRREFERMYNSRVLGVKEYRILSKFKPIGKSRQKSKLLVDRFGTDEEYEKYVKDVKEHNARGFTPLSISPRKTVGIFDYRHCDICRINIEILTFRPLPLSREDQEEQDNKEYNNTGYREFEDEDGNTWKEVTMRNEFNRPHTEISIITPKELENRKIAKRKIAQLQERYEKEKLYLAGYAMQDEYNVNVTRKQRKEIKRLTTFSPNDPIYKDKPYNILLKRYKDGKIKFNWCLCCTQRTKAGLVNYDD